MTRAATELPIILVNALASLINRSIPKTIAIDSTGIWPTTGRVAAKIMNPLPVTPAAPLDVNVNTNNKKSCSLIPSGSPRACAKTMEAHDSQLAVPSKLHEQPVRITKRTKGLLHPARSNFPMIEGRTDTDAEVPKTISRSSLIYPQNFQKLILFLQS